MTGHGLSTNIIEASLEAYLRPSTSSTAPRSTASRSRSRRASSAACRDRGRARHDLPRRGHPGRRRRGRGRRRRPARPRCRGRAVRLRDRLGAVRVVGGVAIDAFGVPIRDEDVAALRGGRRRLARRRAVARAGTTVDPKIRPEQALFALRGGLGLFANLRPVTIHPALARDAAPVGRSCSTGVDLLIVRELTGGLYFGEPSEAQPAPTVSARRVDTMPYSEAEIRRVVRLGFELARGPPRRLTSVDKQNVLATSRLWRTVVEELRPDFPDVEVDHQLVDAARCCSIKLAGAVRRHRHREPVRRHPVRRGERARWFARACCRRPRSASAGPSMGCTACTSRSTGRRRTSPAGTWPTRSARSSRPRCCCAGRWAARRPRRPSRRRSPRRSTTAGARATWPIRARPTTASWSSGPRASTAVIDRLGEAAGRRQVADSPVVLYDTTLRDGTQGENITLSLADKLRIARRLDEFGMPYIEGGWPGSNPKDIEFFAAARSMRGRRPGWRRSARPGTAPIAPGTIRTCARSSRPRRRSSRSSASRGCSTCATCSARRRREPRHDRGLDRLRRRARARGDLRRRALLRRLSRRSRLRARDAARGASGRGADAGPVRHERRHAHRRAGPHHRRRATSLAADPDAAPVAWGIHTHNDAELAVANSMAAVAAGIRHVQATINGYGERSGNANIVTILANLALKTGHELVPSGGGRLDGLTDLSRCVAEIANIAPADYQPYVGRSAFAHKGGVHGAAMAKVERSYQHVEPAAVGNVGRLVVSELGGRANTEIRARQLGHELQGSSIRASCRGSSSSSSRTAWPSRAPRPRSSCSSGARQPTTRRRSGSSTTRAWSSSATVASCWPRRRSRSRSTARPCTPRPTATVRSTRSMPRCARPCARSTRPSTTSTSSTTRSASSTATPRPRPGRGSSSIRATAPGRGRRWAATRTSSRHPRRPWPTRSSTRSGSPAPSCDAATNAISRRRPTCRRPGPRSRPSSARVAPRPVGGSRPGCPIPAPSPAHPCGSSDGPCRPAPTPGVVAP